LHVENGLTGLPEGQEQFLGLGRGPLNSRQLQGASGETIVL